MKLVTDFLKQQAEHKPNKVAVVHKGHNYSYAFLETEANRIGNWLRQAGVKPGDKIILYGVNGVRLVTALFGSLKVGAVFVPVHPQTPLTKLEFILQDCNPSAIVVDSNLVEKHKPLVTQFKRPLLLTSNTNRLRENDIAKEIMMTSWGELGIYTDQSTSVKISPDDLAAIIYTSGSTKDPRGVMETHQQVVFATSAINAVIGNKANDVILCGLPLSFDYGLYQIFLAFQVGAKLILEQDFSVPQAIPRILKLNGVTGFPGVPSLFAMLLRSRLLERVELPDLRYITSTGDVFPVSYIRQLGELLPHTTIFPMYGLTECKRVSIMPPDKLDNHEASVGQPLPNTQVSIVNEAGQEVAAKFVGELVVRGPHIMAGYWNDPEETKRRFRCDDSTGEISLYTGDFFRADEAGFLYFVGRNETFIKSRGQKISSAEVETFLCGINGIAEAAVVGTPDSLLGEAVCAFVFPMRIEAVNLADVAEQCKQALLPAAHPKYIIILDSPPPKTPNGKIDREKLRFMAIEHQSGKCLNEDA